MSAVARGRRSGIALAAMLLLAPALAAAQTVTLPPDLSVAHPRVVIDGLAPSAEATIEATRRSVDGSRALTHSIVRRADARGRIVLTESVDDMAVFWSGQARTAVEADPSPGRTRVEVRQGDRRAAAETTSRPSTADLRQTTDTPFPGAVWVRRAVPGKPQPVVIVLGGSEGGDSTAKTYAPIFAGRGYAVLGLPYYNSFGTGRIEGLSDAFADIPVDRLAAVRDWLATQPGIDAGRIGVWGVSKGAEFALIAASRYPWLKAVAAIVPSDVVWEGWGVPGQRPSSFAFGGSPLAYVPYDGIEAEFAKYSTGGKPDLLRAHVDGRAKNPDRVAAARIPIEVYAGPVLVAGGGRDTIWPSAAMTRAIEATRKAAKRPVVAIVEEAAGHALAGPGTDPAQNFTAAGGEVRAIASARLRTWAATLDLFEAALKP